MPASQPHTAHQRAAAAPSMDVVEVFCWTGSGYQKTSGDDRVSHGDVIVRRGRSGRIDVDQTSPDAGTAPARLEATVPAQSPHRGPVRSRRPPSRDVPGAPRWRVVADEIAQRVEQALADPEHPWTMRWPSMREMAEQLGVDHWTVVDAVHHLHTEGVLVKAWVPRPERSTELWVPRVRALGFGSRPTLHGVAAELVRTGVRERWTVLPAQIELAKRFHVSVKFIIRVTRLLAERSQVVKVRIDGRYRWQIIQPHQIRQVDPRLTASAPHMVITEVIARIRAGEFRYRLPGDSTVHDQPFLTYLDLREQYQVSAETVAKVRSELHDLGWIVPSGHKQWRLADHVPPVDRNTHPAPPKQRKRKPLPRNVRARELADTLIQRIRHGAFTDRPFPSQTEVITSCHVGRLNVVAAFDLLEQDSWIEFRDAPHGRGGRVAVLADPLPEQPTTWDTRLAIPIADLGLTNQAVNRLRRAGITTVADLMSRTDQDLLGIRYIGIAYLAEIKRTLGTLGFPVEPTGPEASPHTSPPNQALVHRGQKRRPRRPSGATQRSTRHRFHPRLVAPAASQMTGTAWRHWFSLISTK